jgi:hypothetical protein
LLAHRLQLHDQLHQLDAGKRLDVDLDDLDQRQQFGKRRFELDDVIEGQREAGGLQGLAALDHGRGRRHGFENFQNHRLARQQFQHVAEQKGFVDIDEAAALPSAASTPSSAKALTMTVAVACTPSVTSALLRLPLRNSSS